MIGILAGAAIATLVIWMAREIRGAPLVDERRPVRHVGFDDILITPQGVEIPVAWLASPDDIDDVLACLEEIDRMGAAA